MYSREMNLEKSFEDCIAQLDQRQEAITRETIWASSRQIRKEGNEPRKWTEAVLMRMIDHALSCGYRSDSTYNTSVCWTKESYFPGKLDLVDRRRDTVKIPIRGAWTSALLGPLELLSPDYRMCAGESFNEILLFPLYHRPSEWNLYWK